MIQFSTYEAKTRLSELLALVEVGITVVITRHRKPVARLVRIEASPETITTTGEEQK